MEEAIWVLLMLLVLVMASYMLDRYSCMLLSQSGFALLFGLVCGLLMVVTRKDVAWGANMALSNSLFFNVLLPPIIYEGGFSIKRQAFFRNFPAICSTAILGTVIATCVTGVALLLAGKYELVPQLSWVEAFLFGSLISAVDPVATLACFNKLHAPPLLFNLVFGESVLNDAVAIALYQTLAKWRSDAQLTPKQALLVATNTGGMFIGSLLVSMAITMFGAFLLKRQVFSSFRRFPTYEISLCLIFSLLTYFVADSLNLSGIVALFFSGTMTAHYHFHTISKEAQHSFLHFLHMMAFVCENFVYLFMGTSVVLMFWGHGAKQAHQGELHVQDLNWPFIGVTLGACLVARFFNIFPLLSLSNCFREKKDYISVKFMTIIWFAGLRGSIAFALAKNWSYHAIAGVNHRKLIESTTLMVVLFTTIIIGGLTGPFLQCLGLSKSCNPDDKIDDDVVTVHAMDPTDLGSGGGVTLESALSLQIGTHENDIRPRYISPGTSPVGSPASSPRSSPRKSSRKGSAPYPNRGSMHYIVKSGLESDGMTNSVSLTDLPDDAVLTPRPQFQENDAFDDTADANQLNPTIMPKRTTRMKSRQQSMTGTLFNNWQNFDERYLQPIFGGYSQHSPSKSHHAEIVKRMDHNVL